jgi:predicted ATPase/class 3 adenylate cyclase
MPATGTVTFLFPDLVRSTELLAELGDDAAEELQRPHFEGLRAAIRRNRGREVKSLGDGVMVAFDSAADALGCAVDMQLTTLRGTGGVELRVGVHSGDASSEGGDYFGTPVVVAKRLCDRAQGGEVLTSELVRWLVGSRGGHRFESLGELTLKGLRQPIHAYRVAWTSGPPKAAALAAPTAIASRLPTPPTRTIGRDLEREDVVELLGRVDIRLVTLTGPGGVGKTRLALEVARGLGSELRDGAWFVSLAATASAAHVPSAITQALGVTPLEGETPQLAVERFLAPKEGLLVLDNFEHVLPAVSLVGDLLAAAPSLTVLATSREALRLHAEHRYAVAPLHVPATADPLTVAGAAAGALFVDRSRSHDQGFELTESNAGAVAQICRRLDGLPLAIELAAARTTVLDPAELNTRLADALDVLGGGPHDAPARQRTLRATIDWSHRLLDGSEAQAFACFAVFAGGATTESAQAVTGVGLDALHGLVHKQLLLRHHWSGPDSRLLMLETVREYARERLDADSAADRVRERHCRHYLALAERAEPELWARGEAEWLPRLDAEVDNFRAALDWSIRHGDSLYALRLAYLLGRYWDIRNMISEGLAWLDAAHDAAGQDAPIHDRARARRAEVWLLIENGAAYDAHGLMEEASSNAIEALALSREAGDPAEIADALLCLANLEMANSFPMRKRLRWRMKR